LGRSARWIARAAGRLAALGGWPDLIRRKCRVTAATCPCFAMMA
jgi:hypothetical protein